MKKYLACLFFSSFFAYSMSEGDEQYETRIHNIYLKHYQKEISEQDWQQAISQLPQSYSIKNTDNLWNLSKSFFKNPWYWSKLWGSNPQIENPHYIYKGDSIKYKTQQMLKIQVASKQSNETIMNIANLDIPPQKFLPPVLESSQIPSSLPKLKQNFRNNNVLIDASQWESASVDRRVIVPAYITDQPPVADGYILKKQSSGNIISMHSEAIIVKIKSGANPGDIFTVFSTKNQGVIKSIFKILTLQKKSTQVVIKGMIKIISPVKKHKNTYLAYVHQVTQGMQAEDQLFKGHAPYYHFTLKGPAGEGQGHIMASLQDQLFLSVGSVVYLNAGLSQGVKQGDVFYIIWKKDSAAFLNRDFKYGSPILGKLKIIHCLSKNQSTGIIISAKHQIYVGDSFVSEKVLNSRSFQDPIDDTSNLDIESDFENETQDSTDNTTDIESDFENETQDSTDNTTDIESDFENETQDSTDNTTDIESDFENEVDDTKDIESDFEDMEEDLGDYEDI